MSLLLICGLAWTITYIEAIRVGIRDKSYAVPYLALAFNMTWEIYYGYKGYFHAGFNAPVKVCLIWILFDLGIIYSYFKYGQKEWGISARWFYMLSLIICIVFLILQFWIERNFGIVNAAIYSAFCSNLIMSLLFVRMYFNRSYSVGQSLVIAYSKCIGTLSATILIGVIGLNRTGGPMDLILIIGMLTLILDVIYIFLLTKRNHKVRSFSKKLLPI